MNRSESTIENLGFIVDKVKAVLVSKWYDDTVQNDSLAPWVRLDEVIDATGLTKFEALRGLKCLQGSAASILYEPADRRRRHPAKWVYVLDCDVRHGLPTRPADRVTPGASATEILAAAAESCEQCKRTHDVQPGT